MRVIGGREKSASRARLVSRQEKWDFTVQKTRGDLTQNVVFSSIFQCSPKRKIQSFPRVFVSVNWSIRSIIRQFSVAVNAGKPTFSGVHRAVNTRTTSCIPGVYWSFPTDQRRVHRRYPVKTRVFRCFPSRKIPVQRR